MIIYAVFLLTVAILTIVYCILLIVNSIYLSNKQSKNITPNIIEKPCENCEVPVKSPPGSTDEKWLCAHCYCIENKIDVKTRLNAISTILVQAIFDDYSIKKTFEKAKTKHNFKL